jgi:mxaJ protein
MCSVYKRAVVGVAVLIATATAALPQPRQGPPALPPRPPIHQPGDLWVCADPNNLPFSDQQQQGFENAIVALIGRDLNRTVRYFWQPQRRGFVRTTLNAGNCDLIAGVPANYPLVEATQPYYRSTYVFISRRDRRLRVRSFDDPRLPKLLIGIQLTGEDYENPPAAQALAARHLANNVRGFTVYGDYSQKSPQRGVVDAVAKGRVDTAVVWGPIGGYFAARAAVPLDVTPIELPRESAALQYAFDISMGVRRGDRQFAQQLDQLLSRRVREIDAILKKYAVPLLPLAVQS